jgi:hypothetical protein
LFSADCIRPFTNFDRLPGWWLFVAKSRQLGNLSKVPALIRLKTAAASG